MNKKTTRNRARTIKRDNQGRFARVYATAKGATIALMVYGVFVGGFVGYKKIHDTETYSLTAAPAEASAIFPIGEEKEYDPCGLTDVVCEAEKPTPKNEVEKLIIDTFGSDAKIALAVAKAESGMNTQAVGWNCRYGNVSQSCKPEDRGKAWSVDCGLFQINHPGQACPKELMDIRTNVERAKEMHDRRGWSPWVAYNTGKHEKYISK